MADESAVAPATPPEETPEQKLARLESENAELRSAANSQTEPGSASTESAAAPENQNVLSPLQHLAQSVSEKPDVGFIGHLEHLAADGMKAVISPGVESDVLGVLAALVSDIVKVKL